MRPIRISAGPIALTLDQLERGRAASVDHVRDTAEGDAIAQRLRDLGFVAGEPVRVVALGPVGAEPLLVQIGYTRFALRRSEAARVVLAPA
jgi:ferrous iron transport protein A